MGLDDIHDTMEAMSFARKAAGTVAAVTILLLVSIPTDLFLFALIDIGIQWIVALAHAIPKQTERYFDVTGSATHVTLAVLGFLLSDNKNWRNMLLTVFVCTWTIRLGHFLYVRISENDGVDKRFRDIRVTPLRFFSAWSLQGVWIFLTQLPVFMSFVHSDGNSNVHVLDVFGILLWVTGFVIEVVADHQKWNFRLKEENKDKFIRHGLWYYSQHPNYFGEMLMWCGIYFISVHSLTSGWYMLVSLLSPLFVIFLLTKVSGITHMEELNEEKWGLLESYKKYKSRTSSVLLLPKKQQSSDEEDKDEKHFWEQDKAEKGEKSGSKMPWNKKESSKDEDKHFWEKKDSSKDEDKHFWEKKDSSKDDDKHFWEKKDSSKDDDKHFWEKKDSSKDDDKHFWEKKKSKGSSSSSD